MKFLGIIKDPKDVTTKEYVDGVNKKLDDKKVDSSSMESFTEDELLTLWNQYIK